MIAFKKLDHILICIRENAEEEGKKFYKGVIGLEEIPGEHPNGAIWFKIGDIELHVRPENGQVFISSRHPAFEVEHLQQAKDALESKCIRTSLLFRHYG